jgi:hypothetical protein
MIKGYPKLRGREATRSMLGVEPALVKWAGAATSSWMRGGKRAPFARAGGLVGEMSCASGLSGLCVGGTENPVFGLEFVSDQPSREELEREGWVREVHDQASGMYVNLVQSTAKRQHTPHTFDSQLHQQGGGAREPGFNLGDDIPRSYT